MTPDAPPRPPQATYRLQLGPDCGFAEAAELVDYLADLGVSHLYLSPVLQARPGSTHGYDVADPSRVSEALGGEQGLRALAARAGARGLGLVVDIVPNHVGTGPDTPLWEALLAQGPGGEAARCFDVDWDPPLPGARGKVILPVLGGQYGRALHDLRLADGRLRYFEHSFPLAGQPAPGESVHDVAERQHYRLVWWRAGDALVNYRRFFAINDLAGVRVEDEAVFDATHARILGLVTDGVISGLRIDHPDGLADPRGYLTRLAEGAPGAWMVAEKILAPDEALPGDWPVAGTTGYDFTNDVLGLFVDPSAGEALDATARVFDAVPVDRGAAVRAAKAQLLCDDLAADARRVAARLWTLTQRHPEIRDVDDRACLRAVTETLQRLGVYRTYVDPFTGAATPADAARIAAAAGEEDLGRFLTDVLAGRAGRDAAHLEVVRRFQQLSAAVMAKGVEDTYLYRDLRLTAVNEVGAEPGALGVAVETFHRRCAARPAAGMLTTATHDTKRGEDTRLRIAALSEIAADWDRAVRRWAARHRALWPHPAAAYLAYQTLIGVWPPGGGLPDARRVRDYLLKAEREAKLRTSWTAPDQVYEAALGGFVGLLLDPSRSAVFQDELGGLARRAAAVAMVSSLAQTLLRCTAPGVPDTYQGTELWDDSLVDPDNRRPVDFPLRRRLLTSVGAADPAELLAAWPDGRIKLWLLWRSLHARRERPACFAPEARYQPLTVDGRWAGHVVAFLRTAADGSARAAVVVPRLAGALMAGTLTPPLGEDWADTAVALPSAAAGWRDWLTGARRGTGSLCELCSTLPVALLIETVESPGDRGERGGRCPSRRDQG